MPRIGDRSHRRAVLAATGCAGAWSRAFAHIVLGLVLIGALILALPARAETAKGEIEVKEQDGYGRLILTFDDPPSVKSDLSGSVLVLSFSKPVDVNVAPIARGLPDYVGVARRDPDGKAIRLALQRRVKVNTMAAGEKLFVDIMPESWKGMPPPLPDEVIADLTRRALSAERIKKELARAQTLPPAKMEISSGSNDDRMRLTFTFSDAVEVRFKHEGRHGILTVPGTTKFDAAAARATLPPEITDFNVLVVGDTLVIRFSAPEGMEMRGSPEGRGYVVDIALPEKLRSAAAVEPEEPPAAAPDTKSAAVDVEADWEEGDYAEEPVPQPVVETSDKAKPSEPSTVAVEIETPPLAAPAVAAVAATKPSRGDVPEQAPLLTPADQGVPMTESGAEQTPAPAEPEGPPVILSDAERAVLDLAEAAARDGVQVRTADSTLQIAFPFPELPAAAAFTRGSSVFAVFDGHAKIDTSRIAAQSDGVIMWVKAVPTGAGTALELALSEPRLLSLASAGKTWILSLGDTIIEPTRPVQLSPAFADGGRTALHAELEGIGTVHRVPDSHVGDLLSVVTLRPPTRGIVRARTFVEVQALPSAQGLVFKPGADDLSVEATKQDVTVTRDGGLTLTLNAPPSNKQPPVQLKPGSPFAAETWLNAKRDYQKTGDDLARAAAAASPAERTKARMQLARFHLANGNAVETKVIIEVAAAESPGLADDPDVRLMRGTALVMLRRFEEAAAVLGTGALAENGEASLWRMIAEAGRGNIALAREAFRKGERVLDAMPEDLQRTFRQTMMEVAVAAHDFATAAAQLDALDMLNIPEGWAMREVMRGRIAEGFEQPAMALEAYRRAMESDDKIAAAEARLHATNLRYEMNEIGRDDAIKALEALATYWRGDATEAQTLASLSQLYKEDHRWRDAFTAMRTATEYHPDEPSTRAIQDKMTAEFARLFLGEGSEAAPPTLESVALFYDFKELTPPGRQGDELIRKLADRLVEVDLLTQAADLLTYQVRNRLEGPARAQVAAHAAAIELMNRKPGRALNVLHDTRIANLPVDLVRSRLILEARALSELQRPDIALEMVAAYSGEDIDRLRADILWAASRWQSAGEALELMLGDAWSKDEKLDEHERQDVMRTAIAYALAEDALGLDRLRQKYAAKMLATPDQHSFNVVTAPTGLRGEEFHAIAKTVSLTDTLKGFLEDYRARYPDNAPPMVRMKEDGAGERTADARPT